MNIQMEDVLKHMLNCKMTRKDIHKTIDDILDRICGSTPKIKILYNTSYGNYELNQDFISFAYKNQTNKSTQEHTIQKYPERIFPAQYIEEFGKHMSQKYPVIACVLNNFLYYDMHDVYTTMNTIKKNPEKNGELITELADMLDIDDHTMDKLLLSKGEVRENVCFYKALQNKKDHTVWYNDCGRYITSITVFLHKRTSATTKVVTDLLHEYRELAIHERLYLELGLLCAADNTCRLAIEEVPTYEDWCIETYNGKEKILRL